MPIYMHVSMYTLHYNNSKLFINIGKAKTTYYKDIVVCKNETIVLYSLYAVCTADRV